MLIKSCAQFFREAAGKRCKKTIAGAMTLDTWEETIEDCKNQLLAQNCPEKDIVINDNGLYFPGGFLLKPREYSVSFGIMKIRSQDYGFKSDNSSEYCWGNKVGAKIINNCLVKECDNGRTITFEIVE